VLAVVFALLLAGVPPFAQADNPVPAASPSPDMVPETSPTGVTGNLSVDEVAVGRASQFGVRLTRAALSLVGTKYVFGGATPKGFDCSGFVQYVFASLGLRIPRTADAQYYASESTSGPLAPGDLVFFQTYEPGPSHVGIYLGNGKFVHSAGQGVKVDLLSDSYYSTRYLGATRFPGSAVTQDRSPAISAPR
jgi:cell wall-associated NlpC family hydrolase